MHLAQLNVGHLVDDPDSSTVAEFMNALGPINQLGESSPGFVWMLKDENGAGAVGQRFPGHEDDKRFIANLTVWTDVDSLHHFTTRSGHAMYLRRRREWFEKSEEPTTVLWWIDDRHTSQISRKPPIAWPNSVASDPPPPRSICKPRFRPGRS